MSDGLIFFLNCAFVIYTGVYCIKVRCSLHESSRQDCRVVSVINSIKTGRMLFMVSIFYLFFNINISYLKTVRYREMVGVGTVFF